MAWCMANLIVRTAMLSYFTALAYRRAALIRNMIAPPCSKKAENANSLIFCPITMSTTITAPMRPPSSNINPGALWSALAIVVIGAWYLGQAAAVVRVGGGAGEADGLLISALCRKLN